MSQIMVFLHDETCETHEVTSPVFKIDGSHYEGVVVRIDMSGLSNDETIQELTIMKTKIDNLDLSPFTGNTTLHT